MKVAIYSPYLDTFGGGERYMLTLAECLSLNHSVNLLLDNHLYSLGAESLRINLGKRFDLDLSKVITSKAPVGKDSNALERFFFLQQFDYLFYLTDGSIFYSLAKKNILHIQSPLNCQPTKNLWGKFKLNGWDLVIYNSNFTKINSERYWPIASEVIYPPVDIAKIKPLRKIKNILSVGRFFGYLKDKKHELMIRVFKNLYKQGQTGDWSLHLAGSVGEGDRDYLNHLRALAKGIPVKFYPNLDYNKLTRLYGASTIYWHAAGFGEDDPGKMEHFGISTVEAMAAGCIPIVVNKGGQKEIVEQGKSGFLWDSLEQLKKTTLELMKDEILRKRIIKEAINQSKQFSKERFTKNILKLINENK